MTELPLLPSGKPDYQPSATSHSPRANRRILPAACVHCSPMCCRSTRTRSGPTRASSTSAAIRCPMWPCRFGWSGRWADSPATGSGGRWPSWSTSSPPERRPWPWLGATLETSVALRAAAIVLIVGSHATLYEMWGGAHLLLGIAGYNFGRFCLTPVPARRPGCAPAQDNCVDRRAVGDMDRGRAADHRRLSLDRTCCSSRNSSVPTTA